MGIDWSRVTADDLPADVAALWAAGERDAVRALVEHAAGQYLYVPTPQRIEAAQRRRSAAEALAAGEPWGSVRRRLGLTRADARALRGEDGGTGILAREGVLGSDRVVLRNLVVRGDPGTGFGTGPSDPTGADPLRDFRAGFRGITFTSDEDAPATDDDGPA